jgi:asparagine synthase (glutamine-hydrolysing)
MYRLLKRLDGVYVLAATDGNKTVIARDRIGIRQLYYTTDKRGFAFSTEKKSLYDFVEAYPEITRLPPGYMTVIEGDRFDVSRFWTPDELLVGERIENPVEAIDEYGAAIRKAIRKRLQGKDRVGVIFSGGIDSVLVAHLINEYKVPLTCYTAGCPGADDLEWAKSAADLLGFPIVTKVISQIAIEEALPEIIHVIEDHSYNQVEAATAMFFAMSLAKANGEQTVFTGQAADEIFGGYPWYPKIVDTEGYEQFERYAWEDFLVGYKETFERENKIAAAHGLDMMVPYADPDVDRIAFRILPGLKIKQDNDEIQKRVHRDFAFSAGIPLNIAYRKKAAAQHGANIHDAYEEMGRKAGISESELERAGYDPEITVSEKLGSSSRYGFRYGDEHLWKPSPCVQYQLDLHAARLGLFSPEAYSHIEAVRAKIARRPGHRTGR